MKKLLLIVTAFIFGAFASNAQMCDYSINGFDSWGDGWNGGSITIDVAGTVTNFTLLSGSTGTITIPSFTNDNVTFTWNSGSFEGEVSFDIYAPDGTLLLSGIPTSLPFSDVSNSMCAPPACLTPTALSATTITSTSADLGWTDNASAGLSNIEYGSAGFALGTGTQVSGSTNNPEPVTGLTPSTPYQFYIQSDCGGGLTSSWAGPFNFLTSCAPFSGPWSDDVESIPATLNFSISNCWTATSNTGYDWNVTGSGTTPSSSTGALAAYSGTNYFYTEASAAAIGATATLTTPTIDATSLTVPELKFWYHMTGTQMGDLAIEAWNGSAWAQVGLISGEQQASQADAFLEQSVILSGYNIVDLQLRFIATSAGSYEGDLCIDDVSVVEAPTCPAPMALVMDSSDLTTGSLSWTPTGSENQWEIEYGPAGFTPGTGTSVFTSPTPNYTITGLTSNLFYDVYVMGVCGVADSSLQVGPIGFNTYNQPTFMDYDNNCGPGFMDISSTGTLNLLGDDGEVGATMPFSLLYQGTPYSNMTIGSNGALIFGTLTAQVGFTNQAMAGAADGLYPWWDDLYTETSPTDGVYFETIGTAPNQTYIVQWNKPHISGNGLAYIFQAVIDEATGEIYYLYDVASNGAALYDFGNSATIGAAGPTQDLEVSFNDPQYLTDNSCVHFYYTDCPKPVNFSVSYVTADQGAINWSAGLAGEMNWTVIYGVAGFDPTSAGTTVSTSSPALIMPGLDDITTYDVYIYADCSLGLQSLGIVGQFTTLPNCADPSGFAATTAVDSLMTGWAWTENVGYPSIGFDIEYGWNGFAPGTGTMVGLDNNFTDTTQDVSLLAGGVYQVYVQALCAADSSSWVGPITFIMPLTNDTVCGAEILAVDGSVYIFDNTGATVTPEEAAITPPTTGFNGTNLPQLGWGPMSTTLENTTWFTFIAPASGSMTYSGGDEDFFASQVAIYETDSSCSVISAMNLFAASDQTDASLSFKVAPNFTICGLTPGQTYYILNDSWSNGGTGIVGQYSISLTEIVIDAGTDNGLADICLGDSIDLFTNISGNDAGGVWSEDIPTANFNDPIFVSAGLASQEFGFTYVVTNGCAADTTVTSVEIYAPSSAGNDGTIDACMNQPINLLSGLNGNVDLGGSWYDPTNTLIASTSITTSSIPGQFNYDYITGNGVCPDDTANVIVDVDFACDYLNLQDLFFNGMDIHPNPTTGMVYISNAGSSEVFNLELTDLQGKVIATQSGAINGTETTEVNLANLETGIYMIRLFNENAEKTFRVVKQ